MTDQDSTRIKHREVERWFSGLKMAVRGIVVYVILAYGPVPGWLAIEPSWFTLAFLMLVLVGIGYVGMVIWQWHTPIDEALTAEDLAE